MQDAIASFVHPVLTQGLTLKERVQRGERLDMGREQARLRRLLLAEGSQRYPDFAGEGNEVNEHDRFLGIRYALACWLDEIFINDSPWGPEWNAESLEWALFHSNDRAFKFWNQADMAKERPGSDSLEGFYLCVMLGFRGNLRENPEELRARTDAARARITKSQEQSIQMPAERTVPVNPWPLAGRERFQKMVRVAGGVGLALVLVLAILLVQLLGGKR